MSDPFDSRFELVKSEIDSMEFQFLILEIGSFGINTLMEAKDLTKTKLAKQESLKKIFPAKQ